MLKVKPFLLFIILTMFVTLFTTACSNTDDSSTLLGDLLNPKVTKVSVQESNITLGLAENETYQIIVTITPSNAVNKEVTYSSSDAGIAEVSSTGLITPKKEGIATITVTSVDNPDVKAKITVDVIASSGNNQGGSTGGDNTGDNTGDNQGGSTGGEDGGNTGGEDGGNTGGEDGGNTGGEDGGNTGGEDGGNTGGGDDGNDTGTDIKWDNLPSSPITGTSSVFDEELPAPATPVDPDNILALIGHYRIQYMTIAGPDGSKVVDNIVGTGNNMRGEIAVNAVQCTQDPVSCPVGLTIKMQYKSQFHQDIVSQGIPSTIEYVRKDIYSPLSSITDIAGEFAKLGAEIVEDTNKPGEYVVKFTLNSPDLPMPKGYTMQVTLKKIADDTLSSDSIVLDDTRYWSAGGETGPVKVTGVTVTNGTIGLEVGETAQLNYTITPFDAENKAVVFASYDDKIAKISEDGTIEALSAGKTEVEVRTVDGGFSAKAVVTVVDKVINVEGITAGEETVILDINPAKAQRTADVKFSVTPLEATNKTILLKDGYDKNLIDAKIVNDANGIATLSISAKFSTGTTDITVYAEGNPSIEKTVQVTVNDTTIRPASVSINKNTLEMTVDDVAQLVATITPADAYIKTVKWSSNNVSAVKVDENTGKLTAVGAGKATITVTTVDGNLQATCEVNVANKHVAVTGVSFSEETAKFGQNATDISVVANVSPSDATNKGITYESSNPEKVQVDATTGALTIIDKDSTSDYSVTITAKSNENELLTDTITVTITSNFVAVTNVTITNKLESPYELKLGAKYTPVYTVEPEDATNKNVIISSEGDVLTYDAESKTFTANRAGEATITVKSESNPEIQDTFAVTVWQPANITGKYNVKSLEIQYEDAVAKSSEANTAKAYHYDNKFFAVSTANGTLDITGKIHIVWSQFVENPVFDPLRYRYFSYSEALSDRENSVDKLSEKGFTINSDGTITYEFPFDLGENNTLVYNATSSNKLIFTLDNQQPYEAIIAGPMRTMSPVYFEDDNSLHGTYELMFFGTNSNGSGFKKAIIQTNCDIFGQLWGTGNCKGSTGDWQITDTGYVGRALIKVDNDGLIVHTKVAMKFGGLAASASKDDQYQYTVYNKLPISSWLNTSNKGDMPGRNLSSNEGIKDATFYMEQNKTYNNKTEYDIIFYSTFKKDLGGILGSVYPDTRLVFKKISEDITPMDPNSLDEEPFTALKDQLDLQASGNISVSIN